MCQDVTPFADLFRPNADRVFNRKNKNFTVADLAGFGNRDEMLGKFAKSFVRSILTSMPRDSFVHLHLHTGYSLHTNI